MQSALEKEILQVLLRFRAWLDTHDRAVLLGLVLSIPPIFPVPIIGLSLALFHYRLWKLHRLEKDEISVIRISLLLSTLSSVAAICLVYFVFNLASTSSVEGAGFLMKIWGVLVSYLQGPLNMELPGRHLIAI